MSGGVAGVTGAIPSPRADQFPDLFHAHYLVSPTFTFPYLFDDGLIWNYMNAAVAIVRSGLF
jgi:hypothetical protein